MKQEGAKRQRWVIGSVVQIPLNGGKYSYCILLDFPLVAFLDTAIQNIDNIDSLCSSDVLFKVWVMKYAITKNHWEIVSKIAVPYFLRQPPVFFKQEVGTDDLLFYHSDGREEPAIFEQVKNLERAAVWDPEHVEDRLNDYMAGRKNKWVESMRPRHRNG